MTQAAPVLHYKSALIRSRPIEAILGVPTYLKMDCQQPTGSFKIRGVGYACQRAAAKGAQRLVSSSGGNAGYAVAYAGAKLGLPVTVYLSRNAPAFMKDKIAAEGAKVVVHGDAWDEANVAALQDAQAPGAFYIHPFDMPDLWQGHASLIDEMAADGVRPAAIAVAVGGGGLLLGVLEGLERNAWHDTRVIAVETTGTASLAKSIAAGRVVSLDRVEGVAHSLGAKTIAAEALSRSGRFDVRSVVVSDREAVTACRRFADDHRALVEPACGAALATGYFAHPALLGVASVAIVVCGGVAVTLDKLTEWAQFS